MVELFTALNRGDVSERAVGARLKLLRYALGIKVGRTKLTQKEMADLLGAEVNNYQHIERGKQYPRPHYIETLREKTGIDHNLIYAGDHKCLGPELTLAVLSVSTLDEAD